MHLATTWAARGIWSDGTTVWVSDYKAAKLFAYTLATGDPAPDSDITLHHLNDSAQGIWSDGTTIWVAQWNSPKFFAYDLATGAYDPEKDFDRTPGNRYPRDVWSDGTTLYVSDHFGKLFAYNMTEPAMDAELSALTLSGITLSPQFASSIYTYTYSADAATTLAETKVMATTNNSSAVAVIKLNGVVDTDGTVDLKLGENIITVEVTAADGMTMKTYTVTVTLEGTVSFESGEYYVSEGDAVEVTMVLSHALPRNATITFPLWTSDDGSMSGDYTVPETITFGANQTSASFTVTAIQDTAVEGDELVLVFFTLPISEENLTYGDPATTIVTIVDDYTPGMTVTPSPLDVDEGATATYTVKLDTAPTDDVTVAISSNNTDVTVSPTSLTFTMTTWNSAQTVTVSAGQDADAANDMATLTHNPSGADYGSVGDADLAVTVTDDETAGVTVTPTSLMVNEGDSGTYTVKLDTQPTSSVTVTVNDPTNTDVMADPASLTFSTSNWATPQTVTVSAAEDDDSTEDAATVMHTVSGGDYASFAASSVAVTVTDNDTPGVTVAPTPLTVNEGSTDTYTVVLNTLPTGTVMVDIMSNNTDVTVSPSPLTFTTTTWSTEQTVTVSAGQDDDAANDMATLTHVASGADYGSVDNAILTVTVTDNDTRGVTVTPTSLPLNEGGSGTYTVKLNTQPSGDVTVTVNDPTDNLDVTAEPASLSFSTTDWATEQTVTVSAAEDDDSTHDTATVTHTLTGGDYASFAASNVVVTVTDNDTPGVSVSPLSLTVGEGSTGTYSVVLNTQPSGNVMVAISSNNTEVTVPPSSSSLTFTTTNWSAEQTITVSAGEDADAADDMATLTHDPSGADYGSVSSVSLTVTVNDNDNDTRGVTVSRTSLTVNEGGNGTYTVKLDTQPSADVTVTVNDPTDNGDVTADPASLTFTTSNWATAQTVTVSAAEDADSTQDTATVTHTVAGGDYDSFAASSVAVTVTDNDTPGVTVTPMSLTVAEGSTNTYDVKLNTAPTAVVTVTISSNNTDVTVSSSPLTFTTSDWSTEQTVTVSAGQDADAADEMATLTHDPSGANYGSVSNAILMVTVTDDDTAGLVVTPPTLSIGEAGSDTFTVKLATQPGGNVAVSVTSGEVGAATVSPASLSFNATNWNTAQTVTVSGVDDADTNNESVTVTLSGSGGGYGSAIASVAVTVTDNDSPAQTPPPPTTGGGSGGGGGGGGGGGFGASFDAPQFVDGFRTSRPLAENARAGDAVGDPVAATHPRNSAITYSLSGTDAARFTVDEETGQIRLGQAITLALGQTYTVNLTGTDSSGTGAIIIVDIEVAEAPYHRYDLNKNGSIEKDEVLAAVADYFAARIEKPLVLEVVSLYFAA